LEYLPISVGLDRRKGEVIYDSYRPSTNIYLVSSGKVKLSHLRPEGTSVLLDIVGADELFGESAFLKSPSSSEQAVAVENSRLMVWSISRIEELMTKEPRLAVAFLQLAAQRVLDSTRRIESFSSDTIEQRLARSLIRFSERLGADEDDGAVRMIPFTHQLLASYVGASREIITAHMTNFRRQGYVRYSRQGIIVYREALSKWLN
jgi:CRP/FNR family transcriptional regulator